MQTTKPLLLDPHNCRFPDDIILKINNQHVGAVALGNSKTNLLYMKLKKKYLMFFIPNLSFKHTNPCDYADYNMLIFY